MGSDNLYWMQRRSKLERKSKKDKEYKNSILIVCEGEKTEKHYFSSFPVANIKVKAVGTGRNTVSLVEEAVRIWEEFANIGNYYERLWCVLDRDDFLHYNETFRVAPKFQNKINKKHKRAVGRSIKIQIAYSNEAFEIWYLLHFDYFENSIERSIYEEMLTKRMGKKYKKNDPGMYLFLEKLSSETDGRSGQAFAIKNAKKIAGQLNEKDRFNHNPSTNVYELVEELNKNLKK